MRYSHARSPLLDLFLATQREMLGRFSFEPTLIPLPTGPEVAAFAAGFESWAPVVRTNIPTEVAAAVDPADLVARMTDHRLVAGAKIIADALAAAEPILNPIIAEYDQFRANAIGELEDILGADRYLPALCDALGAPATNRRLDLHLVPFAPHTPAAGYLADQTGVTGIFVDCNRFRGTTMADSVLTMLSWPHLMETREVATNLSVELARRLPGATPYQRRLRLLLTKALIEMLAGHLVRSARPDHRPCFDVLGTQWRYPRLFAVAERHWMRYLRGDSDRDEALAGIAGELSAHSARWFVDPVDPASIAADFYLLEWMAANGNRDARVRLANWLPQLCADFAGHLDSAIGSELGHFGRVPFALYTPELAGFLDAIRTGDSRVAWPRIRSDLGYRRALDLASQAFGRLGREFGGAAWYPITTMMLRYVQGEIPDRVFVDQCFTLEHNNGSVFDKFYDIQDMRTVLDAQARTDVDTLIRHASPAVRELVRGHQEPLRPPPPVAWPFGWFDRSLRHARPGALACGNRAEPTDFEVGDPLSQGPVSVRRLPNSAPIPDTLNRYTAADATLHTTLGDIALRLWVDRAPYTVDNFVGLATGRRDWFDPRTNQPGTGPFYDGTVFHRREPGFLIHGGDRLGTGEGSAGYRWFEEISAEAAFDQPFRLGMVNRAGPGSTSTGSQFFITVAPAAHLDGAFACFGEVVDAPSRRVVSAIAASPEPVWIDHVTVTAQPLEEV